MLEVCVDSLESAVNAIRGGADELEVCSSLAEGGLTPSAGLVRLILNEIPKINIMLRCRTGTDFCYSEPEMKTMLADLEIFKTMNVDRFVFGAITGSGHIDKDNCTKIKNQAAGIPITFHRAFDVCQNPDESLETIIDLGFSRILTSGQRDSAGDKEALALIKCLIEKSDERIEVMPGAGVNSENAKSLLDIGCKIVHSSCKMVRKLRTNSSLSMGTSDSEYIYITDETKVRELKLVLTE